MNRVANTVQNDSITGLCLLALALLSACSQPPPFPPVSLDGYLLADGFRLQCIAAEPLLDAPVAMTFDTRGRIWVAEMRGYMTDLDNSGETRPNGRISILEDTDGDGVLDTRKTFLDSLVLPRALALVYGGLLYAEPPKLWFVEIRNDRPGARMLVDSAYATGGNVEHQPNGLLLALDNWIYSAKSDRRYRRLNGRWRCEKTHFRGQWGITEDAYGRLFYNDNSNQLQGDWVLPNALLRNRFFNPSTGFNVQICTDQRVFPLQPTAVNRGYETGMLDSAGRLRNVTSACAPLLYRGGQFPPEYTGNAFVCAPEANAVKRNIFEAESPQLQARQAYNGHEFLAAYDKAFRPVGLCEGPDGALYVVDMHRGVIQHKTYMTAYLRGLIQAAGLDTVTGQGRILRITSTGRPCPAAPRLDRAGPAQWVQALAHPNAWVRDRARQLIVERGDTSLAPRLLECLNRPDQPLAQLQAIWALEGLGVAAPGALLKAAQTARQPGVVMSALQVLEPLAPTSPAGAAMPVFDTLAGRNNADIDLALCLYAPTWARYAPGPVFGLLQMLLRRHPADTLYQTAVVSGLSEQESAFQAYVQAKMPPGEMPFLRSALKQVIADRRAGRLAAWTRESIPPGDGLTAGLRLYNTYCGACHGPTGQGTLHLAPPLDGSPFIHGNPDRLILIALHGLQGPVRINGVDYAFNAGMPGLGANPDCSDKDLAAILTFVRNAFSREPANISAEKVQRLRAVRPGDGSAFTAAELERRLTQ